MFPFDAIAGRRVTCIPKVPASDQVINPGAWLALLVVDDVDAALDVPDVFDAVKFIV